MGIMKFFINKISAQIIYDMLMELLMLLNQYHTNSLLRHDHINKKFTAIVWWTKHRGRCQGFLKSIERLLGSLIPVKRGVPLQKMHKAFSQVGKINHEYSQEVLPPFTHLGHVIEIFKPLSVSLGAGLDSRLSPCS